MINKNLQKNDEICFEATKQGILDENGGIIIVSADLKFTEEVSFMIKPVLLKDFYENFNEDEDSKLEM